MWDDVSKSAFLFGIGTFVFMSSSYAKDLNIVALTAYCPLWVFLAIVLFRSPFPGLLLIMIIQIGLAARSWNLVGETDSSYGNEFLLIIKALFTGNLQLE